jgi:4-amino-4-deoxy-L-arabinose transferase-like glycosyltransferase
MHNSRSTTKAAAIQMSMHDSSFHSTASADRRSHSGSSTFFSNTPTLLASIVLFALALRLVVVFFAVHGSGHTIHDSNFGWESWEMGWTARSLYLGQGFSSPFLPITGPTALVPPLYPFIIATAFRIFGLYTTAAAFAVLGFNSLCSALTCIPLFFLVRRAINLRSARIAAIAWALYPFSVYFSADRVWDYALTALLFTTCLLLAQQLHRGSYLSWTGFGALYGIAALSNPSVVSLLPFLLLIAIFQMHKQHDRWFGKALLASVAFILVCTPWTLRNDRVMHAHFFLRDGFWEEAYAGNNGDTTASNTSFTHPASSSSEMQRYQQLGEIAYMANKRHLAVDFITHHPRFFAIASLRRILRFWTGYWSFQPNYLKYEPMDLPNVPFCIFLTIFMVRGLLQWWRRDRRASLPYLIALLVFPIPYYLTHSSTDYRQPIEPIIVIFVTIGLFGLSARQRSTATVSNNTDMAAGEAESPARDAVLV